MTTKEQKAIRHQKVENFRKELRTYAGVNLKLIEITEKVRKADWSVDFKVIELLSRKTYVCAETKNNYQIFLDAVYNHGGPALQKKANEFAQKAGLKAMKTENVK